MPRSKSQGLSREQEEEIRVETLLDVAAEMFRESGFNETKTTEIARRAKTSKQTFYLRFPSKEKLFHAVVEREVRNVSDAFSAYFDDELPLREALLDVARHFHTVVLGGPNIALLRIIYAESPKFPEIGEAFIKFGPERINVQLLKFFVKQMKIGALKKDDPKVLVEHFVGLVQGQSLERALVGVPLSYTEKQLMARLERSVDVFLSAYVSDKNYSNSQSKS